MTPTRRQVLLAAGAAVLPAAADRPALPLGNAEHVILLWMGGGMCHLDTFDPKRRGEPKAKKPGSDCDSIPTAVPGVRVSEHLARTAPLMDRVTALRTISHKTIDEHATASYFVHTGRLPTDTTRYPSIGSLIAHGRPAAVGVPGYVVVGIPNVSRDPGFLGPKFGYLTVPEAGHPPAGFAPAGELSTERQARRAALREAVERDPSAAAQAEAAAAFRALAGPAFLKRFDLSEEPAGLREQYGPGLGQRCLLARRLVEAGTRVVEVSFSLQFVNGAGWDTHDEAQLHAPQLVRELDAGFATLLEDLGRKKLLDKTLVVIATEFGRPPEFDKGGGRGHQSKAFSCVLAGGGLKHRGAVGTTDDLGKAAVDPPVTVPDYLATVLAAAGIDPRAELQDGNRPVPRTDGGRPVAALFS